MYSFKDGLSCGETGLTYGALTLVSRSATGKFQVGPFTKAAAMGFADRDSGLQAVANALNQGNLGLAQIAALHLRLPPVDAEMARHLVKYNFDPNQPRDWHGRWSSEDSGDASGSSGASAATAPYSNPTLPPTYAADVEEEPANEPAKEEESKEEDEVIPGWDALNRTNAYNSAMKTLRVLTRITRCCRL
jgi:hypothetical protein